MYLFSILVFLLYSFTFKQYWGWFVVPIFSVPSLNFFQALGLISTAWLLFGKANFNDYQKEEIERFAESLTFIILLCFFILWGWLIHFWI
jgi:hypothetical protein